MSASSAPSSGGQVSALRGAHSWHTLPGTVGRATVGADTSALPRALLNSLRWFIPPMSGPGRSAGFRHPGYGVLDCPASGPGGSAGATGALPELHASGGGIRLPAVAPQVRRGAAPVQVAAGTLRFGEPLKLPAGTDTAYWAGAGPAPGSAWPDLVRA